MASVYKRKSRNGKPAAKWTALYRDHEQGRWRTASAYPEKAASVALANRLERQSARRAEGLVEPNPEPTPPTPIRELLDDFMLTDVGPKSDRYRQQVRKRIERAIDALGANRIEDLSTVQVARVLDAMRNNGRPLAPASKTDYVHCLRRFSNWCVLNRHCDYDVLATLKAPGRPVAQAVHTRRALRTDEFARLLQAAEERPLIELMTVRTGKNKGKPVAKVRPEVRERAINLGQERRSVYLIAFMTGLRRSEMRALRWSDTSLDCDPPVIRLRARATKSKRADTVVLHPQAVSALHGFKPHDHTPTDSVFRTIPDMKCLKADLKHAGIEYGDAEVGFCDFHALGRVSPNSFLASQGVSARVRQAFLRHTKPLLCDGTYLDETMLPISEEIRRLPNVS